MKITRVTADSITDIDMTSSIDFSFILSFSARPWEQSKFKAGKVYYSYFHREKNGTIKSDRSTRLAGRYYEVNETANRQSCKRLNLAVITYNTHCMYFEEPVNIQQVYSDNFQCMLFIEKKPGAFIAYTCRTEVPIHFIIPAAPVTGLCLTSFFTQPNLI